MLIRVDEKAQIDLRLIYVKLLVQDFEKLELRTARNSCTSLKLITPNPTPLKLTTLKPTPSKLSTTGSRK
jgi:hypothetical protein